MAIKFEKVRVSMTLYDRHTRKFGNTTLDTVCEYPVEILKVCDSTAKVSWNHNAPTWMLVPEVERLSTWSMHDKEVATYSVGMLGRVFGVRKLTKADKQAKFELA